MQRDGTDGELPQQLTEVLEASVTLSETTGGTAALSNEGNDTAALNDELVAKVLSRSHQEVGS